MTCPILCFLRTRVLLPVVLPMQLPHWWKRFVGFLLNIKTENSLKLSSNSSFWACFHVRRLFSWAFYFFLYLNEFYRGIIKIGKKVPILLSWITCFWTYMHFFQNRGTMRPTGWHARCISGKACSTGWAKTHAQANMLVRCSSICEKRAVPNLLNFNIFIIDYFTLLSLLCVRQLYPHL